MDPALLPHVTDDLKADPIAWPILEKMSEKDVPAVLKSYAHSQHRLGTALTVPGEGATPEALAQWRQETLPRLYKAGVLAAPPASPDEYQITKPEGVTAWDDATAKDLATVLHKHGVPKAAVPELLALHQRMLGKTAEGFKTDQATAMAALKAEYGTEFDARMETGKRLVATIFKTPEELALAEAIGLGDHPGFLSVLLRLAPLAEQDSGFLKDAKMSSGTGKTREEARAEFGRVMNDPTHPQYAAYKRGDAAALAYVNNLYKSVAGAETPVTLGTTVQVAGAA